MKYPSALHYLIQREVHALVEKLKAQHPRYTGKEMTLVFSGPLQDLGTGEGDEI